METTNINKNRGHTHCCDVICMLFDNNSEYYIFIRDRYSS